MNFKAIIIISGVIMIFACTSQLGKSENPFYADYDTPFATPPFDDIRIDHYLPAFKEGILQHEAEILNIAENSEEPTFENTLETLEKSGALLRKVSDVFNNMTSANTNEELQKIAKEISPLRTNHLDNIRLNVKLFKRIEKIYEDKVNLTLTTEQQTLLEKY
jgi:peptidyl-dipeptidase Dcp